MTNEEQLKAFEKQIRAAQEQATSLFSHKQQIQSSLETIEAQRGNILRDYATGEEKAEQRLDALDADEKNLRRQLAGLQLHIVEKNATVARREAEAALHLFQNIFVR